MLRWVALLVLCSISLSACSERGKLGYVSSVANHQNIERIFVATTRQRSEIPYDFSDLRTSEVSYARYDVSLPPTHSVGKIEWPKSTPNINTDFVVTDAEVFTTTQGFRSKLRSANQTAPKKDVSITWDMTALCNIASVRF